MCVGPFLRVRGYLLALVCFSNLFSLALRKNDGTYILNGNWAISWPGEYEGAGARFQYTRQDTRSLESIEASGPLNEPVDLLVRPVQCRYRHL